MWIILIIIAICIGAYLLVKRAGEPIEDENTKFLKTQQTSQSNEHTGRYLPNFPTKSSNKNPLSLGIKKIYRIDYDCAYDFEHYPFEIVGEASYQSNISKFAVMRDGKGCFTETEAKIVREPNNSYDKNACRVDIDGLVVGYFARNHAESWVNLLNRQNISDSSEVFVKAVIVGGGSKNFKFGVRLDIPSRVANTAKYIKEI